MEKNAKLYNGLIEFMRTRILYSVATKKCIYNVLQEQIPFADIEVNTVDDSSDNVKIMFGETVVPFTFTWKKLEANNIRCTENYNLVKIS